MSQVLAKALDLSKKEIVINRAWCAVIGILAFALATGLGGFARFYLPGNPVPITMQTFFALMAGAVLGARKGTFSQVLFAFGGAMGLPIFAAGHFGFAYLLGPTGGYILGFVMAAMLVGLLTNKNTSFLKLVLAFGLGSLVIYLCGAVRLAFFVGGLNKAFMLGVLPFILGDAIKAFAAAIIYNGISKRAREIF